jgi:hypothetical protein
VFQEEQKKNGSIYQEEGVERRHREEEDKHQGDTDNQEGKPLLQREENCQIISARQQK